MSVCVFAAMWLLDSFMLFNLCKYVLWKSIHLWYSCLALIRNWSVRSQAVSFNSILPHKSRCQFKVYILLVNLVVCIDSIFFGALCNGCGRCHNFLIQSVASRKWNGWILSHNYTLDDGVIKRIEWNKLQPMFSNLVMCAIFHSPPVGCEWNKVWNGGAHWLPHVCAWLR